MDTAASSCNGAHGQAAHRAHPYHSLYEQVWSHWASQTDAATNERRDDAVTRMRLCLAQSADTLNLSGLGLSNVPPMLPPSVTHLTLSFNRFTELPSDLPSQLSALRICDNQLSSLHTHLPPGLELLDVSHNNLLTLPTGLPDGLRVLLARRNRLTALPAQLPSSLSRLDVAHNTLRRLPLLPAALHELNVCANGLRALPETLPSGLGCMHASNNALRALPQRLPARLAELNLRHNLFTEVPEVLLDLPRWSVVRLEGNMIDIPMRQITRNRNHPHIYTSAPLAGPPQPASLEDAATQWLDTRDHPWHSFQDESNAASFSGFLERLAATRSAQADVDFKKRVAQWLNVLGASPELRAQSFALATHATTTCTDSIALQYNQMQQAWLAHQVHAGELDADLPAVVALGRQLFRLEQLELAARVHTLAVPTADEIEVFLAFQVKLRNVLELHCGAAAMHFYGLSGLERSDLAMAAVEVKDTENRDFRAWLLRWPAWRGVMQRLAPQQAEQVAQRLSEQVTDGHYEHRLTARLEAMHLQDLPDARVQVGKMLMDELQQESDEALAIAVLGRSQCDVLLAPYWPPLSDIIPT